VNWPEIQRRIPLPLVGCLLGVGSYLNLAYPNNSESATASAARAIWAGNPADATAPLLQALRLDPGSPERWTDLAESFYETGRTDDARYCMAQAILRAPGLPHIAMRAAGMYFRLGDTAAALRTTTRIFAETREYDANVFQLWQRLGGPAEQVFGQNIGADASLGRNYFDFLVQSGDTAAVDAAWSALEVRNMAGLAESKLYAESLTGERNYDLAASIEAGILPQGTMDGGFEGDFANNGLGWHRDSIPGVAVTRDVRIRYAGNSALRLEFDGSSGNEFNHVSQTRALAPGVWSLRAMVRTEFQNSRATSPGYGNDLRTSPGIGLRIVDVESGNLLANTPRVNVSHDWAPIEAMVVITPPHARLVRIEVIRPAFSDLALRMIGTVWVDDVTLLRKVHS